jgi:hypothetical protein
MKATLLAIPILILISCNPKSTEKIQSEDLAVIDTDAIDTIALEIEPEREQEEITTEEPDEESFYPILEFERTSCFGKCPTFKVQIFSNGRAFYSGQANVEKTGLFETWVNESFIFLLMQEAEKIDFFALNENYPVDGKDIPDLPKTITFLKEGKKKLRVVDSFDSPLQLQQFEKFLEDKIETLYWKKIEE